MPRRTSGRNESKVYTIASIIRNSPRVCIVPFLYLYDFSLREESLSIYGDIERRYIHTAHVYGSCASYLNCFLPFSNIKRATTILESKRRRIIKLFSLGLRILMQYKSARRTVENCYILADLGCS